MTSWPPHKGLHHNMLGHIGLERTFPEAPWLAPWANLEANALPDGQIEQIEPWAVARQKIPARKSTSPTGLFL
jgi:hypothetical protein